MGYQYSMDIPPGLHWADIWMEAMQGAEIVVVMMDEAYLKSEACVTEFLCSADAGKNLAIVICDVSDLPKLRAYKPSDGANGCGRVVMAVSSGRQLYLKGSTEAAKDIMQRYFDT